MINLSLFKIFVSFSSFYGKLIVWISLHGFLKRYYFLLDIALVHYLICMGRIHTCFKVKYSLRYGGYYMRVLHRHEKTQKISLSCQTLVDLTLLHPFVVHNYQHMHHLHPHHHCHHHFGLWCM